MNNSCELNLPYPEIAVGERNNQYARLLTGDYAGTGSELTAITQYFYQHIILKERMPELSDSLECISITEMRHMEFLAEMIAQFGADPQIRAVTNNGIYYWSGKYPSYNKNPRQILLNNISGERSAIKAYRYAIEIINNENAREVIRRIILDEEHHIEIFEKYLRQLSELE
ncbi:MAG: bacterioferritin [Clostridiales bacterium]|nr:bacterioferritin [Clostridiales bacterium]